MERFSVQKPFTVLVGVIMVLVLGVVSLMNMATDLLPSMSIPMLAVITVYPGASAEKVEAGVTELMESALGTVTGVTDVTSTSSENYSMIQLSFEDDTDMDSAMVKVSSAISQLSDYLPDGCGTPTIMEISLDMLPTMYLSVSQEGADIYELSTFVDETVVPSIERVSGVASVTTMGMVEKSIEVSLNQDKIDAINNDILESVDEQLAEAKEELDDALAEVQSAITELESAQETFGATVSDEIFSSLTGSLDTEIDDLQTQIDDMSAAIGALKDALESGTGDSTGLTDEQIALATAVTALIQNITADEDYTLTAEDIALLTALGIDAEAIAAFDSLSQQERITLLTEALASWGEDNDVSDDEFDAIETLTSLQNSLDSLSAQLDNVPSMISSLAGVYSALTQMQLEAAIGFSTASIQLTLAESELESASAQYETSKELALSSANLDALLDVTTLAQLIYAQNFAMPAGYIDDADDNSWLLKVGEEYETTESLADALLLTMDGVGDITLADVCDVVVIDNADETYARVNGENGVVLAIYKSSTYGTNEAANGTLEALEEIQEKYSGVDVVVMMNQGDYITLIVDSVVSSMAVGAFLAILILALFLKDFMPTLVVGVSIPLSVLFAIVLMYFTDLSLNMMTLCGLALGIGMLVDNSVVAIENIYRLRSGGMNAARAAVQGTKQVAGALVASTLTTICVFLPLLFTSGTTRELLMPMGLCIGYCLFASLIVAVTVVPATASTLLKNTKVKPHPWFDAVQEFYGKTLAYCLRVKAVPLSIAIGLLAFCVFEVFQMGLVMIPDITADSVQVTFNTEEGLERAESYAQADAVLEAILTVENVTDVGVMSGSSTSLLMGTDDSSYGSYTYYITLSDNAGTSETAQVCEDIAAATSALGLEVDATAGGLSDLSAMMSSGLTVTISGSDLETLEETSAQVAEIVAEIEGFTDITHGFGEGEDTIQLVIDKDKAMEYGFTVAQIYVEISSYLTNSATSTTITVGTETLEVVVADNTSPLNLENLMDLEFEAVSFTDTSDTSETTVYQLSEFATIEKTTSVAAISRSNQERYTTVVAGVLDGYNATQLSFTLTDAIEEAEAAGVFPEGYTISVGGESDEVMEMVEQMLLMILLALIFIYLVMVAQFQSLLSPFIVLFTIPLAFTGGLIALLITGENLSLLSMMGFLVLMGTVVNNGIVFVDYANKLRIGGMERRAALVATGKTRMRPIFMTALTTVLAMTQLVLGDDMGAQLGGGMAIVVVGGLLYATLMTLFVVPVMYDIFFKRQPLEVDVGDDNIDDVLDDAAMFIAQEKAKEIAQSTASV